MTTIGVIGAGSVGRALGGGLGSRGHTVRYGVRTPNDPRHADLDDVRSPVAAADGADVVILAVPSNAVPEVLADLSLRAGQVVLDATNAVRTPPPHGAATMGDVVASLVPSGVYVAKAFNTVGAEWLVDGARHGARAFLPVAGDDEATEAAVALAHDLGFDAVAVGGRDAFGLVEAHAQLWIRLAFGCGWGRDFAFSVVRP